MRAATDHPRRRDIDRIRTSTERSPRASGSSGCSTSSSRWRPTSSTCSRPTPGRRAPYRSSPRRRARRWRRRRLGSCSAARSPSSAGRAAATPTATAGDLPQPRGGIAVKEAVMPFNRFRTLDGAGVDTVLGPEMRSTGEVMGIDYDFGRAFAKAQTPHSVDFPSAGARSCPWPTATSDTCSSPSSGWPISASRSWPRQVPPRCCGATESRQPWYASTQRVQAQTANQRSWGASSPVRSIW